MVKRASKFSVEGGLLFKRRINGKVYRVAYECWTKEQAQRYAERLRKKYGSARIIPDGPRNNPVGWLIYVPHKKTKSRKKVAVKKRKTKRKRRK